MAGYRSLSGGTISKSGRLSQAQSQGSSDVSFEFVDIPLDDGGTVSGYLEGRFRGDAAAETGAGDSGSGTFEGEEQCLNCSDSAPYTTYEESCGVNDSNISLAACQCAAYHLYDCYLRNGCYIEAGAPTALTKAELEDGRSTSNTNACQYDNCCT